MCGFNLQLCLQAHYGHGPGRTWCARGGVNALPAASLTGAPVSTLIVATGCSLAAVVPSSSWLCAPGTRWSALQRGQLRCRHSHWSIQSAWKQCWQCRTRTRSPCSNSARHTLHASDSRLGCDWCSALPTVNCGNDSISSAVSPGRGARSRGWRPAAATPMLRRCCAWRHRRTQKKNGMKQNRGKPARMNKVKNQLVESNGYLRESSAHESLEQEVTVRVISHAVLILRPL